MYLRFTVRPPVSDAVHPYAPALRELHLTDRVTRCGEAQWSGSLVMLKIIQLLGRFPPRLQAETEAVIAHLRSRTGPLDTTPAGALTRKPSGNSARRLAVADCAYPRTLTRVRR